MNVRSINEIYKYTCMINRIINDDDDVFLISGSVENWSSEVSRLSLYRFFGE